MRLKSGFTERRALALTLCWVFALAVTGSTDVLLFLAPALLILSALLRALPRRELIKLVEGTASGGARPANRPPGPEGRRRSGCPEARA